MRPPFELKKTLNLPETDFSMKANLPQYEPNWLERGKKMEIYAKIRESRRGAPSYVLHDGPPYANGAIHEGHALNKCLKDFVMFHPDLEYLALEHKGEFYLVAEALAAATVNSCSPTQARIAARFPARQLEYATFAHPFLDRSILGSPGELRDHGARHGSGKTRFRREREHAFARVSREASGQKCERCWNYSIHVGENERHPTVCERCSAALAKIEKELVS